MTDEVVYLSAMEEGKHYVAQANAELDDDGQARPRTSSSAAMPAT